MDNLRLINYTVGDLTEDLQLLREYRDPHRYLRHCTPAWWRDHNLNPHAQPEDLALTLAVDGDIVIGRLAMWAAQVVIDGVRYRAFLLDYFIVHEDYRDTGIGGMLLMNSISRSRCLVAAGGVPPNVQQLYQAVGFRELGPLSRYVYFYNPQVIFKTYLRAAPLASALAVFATLPLKTYYRFRKKKAKSNLEFRPVTSLNSAIDDLPRSGNYFPRSSAQLNWLLATRDNLYGFEVFRDDRICGYCVFRTQIAEAQTEPRSLPEMRVGSLLDFYIDGATIEDKRALINFGQVFLKPKKMDIFECQTKDEELIDVCAGLGLVHVSGFRILFRPPPRASLPDDDVWYLTKAEGDILIE
jgi:predicted N-acetyltransferase YhbS